MNKPKPLLAATDCSASSSRGPYARRLLHETRLCLADVAPAVIEELHQPLRDVLLVP